MAMRLIKLVALLTKQQVKESAALPFSFLSSFQELLIILELLVQQH